MCMYTPTKGCETTGEPAEWQQKKKASKKQVKSKHSASLGGSTNYVVVVMVLHSLSALAARKEQRVP